MFETIITSLEDTAQINFYLMTLSNEILAGKKFDCIIKPHRETRSLNANAYFHLLVNKIADKLKIGNEECKKQLVLEYGTIATNENGESIIIKVPKSTSIDDFYPYTKVFKEKVENGFSVVYYLLYKQTHTLNTEEMSRLIDGTVSEAQELGIETKTPEELAELKSLWESQR